MKTYKTIFLFILLTSSSAVAFSFDDVNTKAGSSTHRPSTIAVGSKTTVAMRKESTTPEDKANQQWWTQFHDEHLNSYVEAALKNNPSLNASIERITEAKAILKESVAKEFPTIKLNPSFYRVGLPSSASGGLALPSTLNFFTLPLSASYEPDIWGKNWNGVQADRKKVASVTFQSHAIANTLTGEVTTAYINLLRNDSLLHLQQDNLTLLQQIAALKTSLHQAGLLSNDEVLRAQRDASQGETDLATTRKQQDIFAHQLSILTGSSPTSAENIQRGRLEELILPQTISADWSEQFLSHRPDVEAQEKILESAHIDVIMAKKTLLPKVNLNAMVGLASTELSQWLNFNQNFLSLLSIGVNQPIFEGGKLLAEIKLRNAMQKEQMENYRQTLLNAMKDVANSLAELRADTTILNNSRERLSLTQHDLELSNSLYQQGLTSHLNVLEAQGEVDRYQEWVIQGQADKAIAMVSLYKALGGGF